MSGAREYGMPLPDAIESLPLSAVDDVEAREMLRIGLRHVPVVGGADLAAMDWLPERDTRVTVVVASLLRRAWESGVDVGRTELVDEHPTVARLRVEIGATSAYLTQAAERAERTDVDEMSDRRYLAETLLGVVRAAAGDLDALAGGCPVDAPGWSGDYPLPDWWDGAGEDDPACGVPARGVLGWDDTGLGVLCIRPEGHRGRHMVAFETTFAGRGPVIVCAWPGTDAPTLADLGYDPYEAPVGRWYRELIAEAERGGRLMLLPEVEALAGALYRCAGWHDRDGDTTAFGASVRELLAVHDAALGATGDDTAGGAL